MLRPCPHLRRAPAPWIAPLLLLVSGLGSLTLGGCASPRAGAQEAEAALAEEDRAEGRTLAADPLRRRIAEIERRIASSQGEGAPADVARLEAEVGGLYLEQGDLRRARRNFRLARYDAPREEHVGRSVAIGLGEIYLREDQPELALAELEPLRKDLESLEPRDELKLRAFLSLAYEQAGRAEDARALRPTSVQEKEFFALRRRAGDKAAPSIARGPQPKSSAPATSSAMSVLPRTAWRAAAPRESQDPMGAVRRITIHHSAMENEGAGMDEAARQIRSIQSGHFQRGYADIGYHFLIDSQGRIWEGRDRRYQGAHAGNAEANQQNLGICLLGNFVSAPPTPAQERALRLLIDAERTRYDVARDQIFGHGEVREHFTGQTTECPGARLMNLVRELRGGRAGNLAED